MLPSKDISFLIPTYSHMPILTCLFLYIKSFCIVIGINQELYHLVYKFSYSQVNFKLASWLQKSWLQWSCDFISWLMASWVEATLLHTFWYHPVYSSHKKHRVEDMWLQVHTYIPRLCSSYWSYKNSHILLGARIIHCSRCYICG
jgi:hypothetical protein